MDIRGKEWEWELLWDASRIDVSDPEVIEQICAQLQRGCTRGFVEEVSD